MRRPRVTVGMPIFNRAHVLRETIDYVLNQSFEDFEFIIFNDGSSDDSAHIVRELKDSRIRFIDSENRGPPHPLNEIYDASRGEYIIILHDHDIFHKELLQRSVEALDLYATAAFVLQGCATVAEDGVTNYREHPQTWPLLNSGPAQLRELMAHTRSFDSPFHACSMIRRSALLKAGPFYEPRFNLYADVDLWMRLLARFDFAYIPDVLLKFRERERSGHIFSDREFEIMDIMRLIYLKNGVALFTDDPIGMSSFLDNLARIFCASERRLALRAFVRSSVNKALALERVSRNTAQPIAIRAAAAIARKTTTPA